MSIRTLSWIDFDNDPDFDLDCVLQRRKQTCQRLHNSGRYSLSYSRSKQDAKKYLLAFTLVVEPQQPTDYDNRSASNTPTRKGVSPII